MDVFIFIFGTNLNNIYLRFLSPLSQIFRETIKTRVFINQQYPKNIEKGKVVHSNLLSDRSVLHPLNPPTARPRS